MLYSFARFAAFTSSGPEMQRIHRLRFNAWVPYIPTLKDGIEYQNKVDEQTVASESLV